MDFTTEEIATIVGAKELQIMYLRKQLQELTKQLEAQQNLLAKDHQNDTKQVEQCDGN